MTFLRINRVVVTQGANIAYDETFHQGVNIIRGDNGVGKSTISNFIYYGLGGDFNDWLPEALKCDFVILELAINEAQITIKRAIGQGSRQPMLLFYGSFEQSSKSSLEWFLYPYNRGKDKESFSQVLFRILEFPEVLTDDDDFITMTQILRLLYIDQISPVDSLIKDIDFDSPLIRQAVGDLVLGIYDNQLFRDQLTLRGKKRDLLGIEHELKVLKAVFNESNRSLDTSAIRTQIAETQERIVKIDDALASRQPGKKNIRGTARHRRVEEAETAVSDLSDTLSKKIEEHKRIDLEIFDTKQFIAELQRQDIALDESLKTRTSIGEFKVSFCPVCLSPVKEEEDPNTCHLCKQPVSEDINTARIFRIKQEIQAQIKESIQINQSNQELVQEIASEIESLRERLKLQQQLLNSVIKITDSDVNNKYDELLVEKGKLITSIEHLTNQLKEVDSFWALSRRRDAAVSEISRLEIIIQETISRQQVRLKTVYERVNFYAKALLKGDGEYEQSFQNADVVEFYFGKNTYSLNSRNNFSASSLVILKNSIRFAIFFASLDLEFMRLPRCIICDNIEDKGMNEKRSKNFQREIVNLASSFTDKEFQIIFTTSMVDESLNIPVYTVGPSYTPTNKALKIL